MFKKINTTKKQKQQIKNKPSFLEPIVLVSLLSQNILLAKTTDRFCRFFLFTDASAMQIN